MHTAPRPRAHELRNLTVEAKLISSLGLVAAMAAYVAAVGVQVRAAMGAALRWEVMGGFGDSLSTLSCEDPSTFVVLLVASLGALTVLLSTAGRLFARTALRPRAKRALELLGYGIVAANAVSWSLTPFSVAARWLAGPIGVLSALVLLLYVAIPLYEMWFYHRLKKHSAEKKRVVIVGGGFAGLYAALTLDRKIGHREDVELEVLDKNNFFLFPPLLPSAATGTIEAPQVTFPFRRVLETTNVRFRKALVERIDPQAKKIHAQVEPEEGGAQTQVELSYDYLILAPGSVTNTFGTPGAEEHAFFMREIGDAMAVRSQIIDCFERAAAGGGAAQAELLRFVVVGAGPTGIEVATEIHDLVHGVLLKRYPEIDPGLVDIVVVQSGKQILPGWREPVVKLATEQVQRLAIRLVLDTRVVQIGPGRVELASGEVLAARTTIWCAGVKPSPLLSRSGLSLERSGRVAVGADLRVPGLEDMLVVGDAAQFLDPRSKAPLPPLGQVAFQQGPCAAGNVLRLLEGKPTEPFSYFDFGALVSVGEHYAAVQLLGVRLSGFIGWFVWRTLYLGKLVGFSNKVRVMLDWTLDLLIERSFSQLSPHPRRSAGKS